MDEISREVPPDTTTGRVVEERTKGPQELLAHERGLVRDDLIVNPPRQEGEPAPRKAARPSTEADPAPESAPEAAPAGDDPVDAAAAAAAVAAEAEVVELEEDLGGE